MRQTALVVSLAMAVLSGVVAQEVALPCDWAGGTVRRYELVREKENTRDGTTTRSRVRTPLTIEVLERTVQGYRIAWSHGTSQVLEPEQLDESQRRLLNITDGLRFVLRTDTAGTPEELLNGTEVAATYGKVLGEIRKTLAANGMAPEAVAQATAPVEAMTKPDRVAAIALKEPNLFFLVTGGSFAPGQAREYEDELVNPFTGKPLVTLAQMRLEPPQPGADLVVEWSQQPKAAGGGDFALRDSAAYRLDAKTGWPVSVHFERSIAAGATRRVERLVFTAAER